MSAKSLLAFRFQKLRALVRFTIYALGIIFAFVIFVVAGAAFPDRTFTVNPDEQAIVLRFGEIKRLVHPGVHRKIPLIEDVYYCSTEVQHLELATVEAQMSDLTPVHVDASVSYAIADCVRFFHSVRSPVNLRGRLNGALKSASRKTLGHYSSADLSDKRNRIVTEVTAEMKAVALSRGVNLTDLDLDLSRQ